MKENTLNHFLSNNDGYGEYETIIASQSNSSRVKRLILINSITVSGIASYFKIEYNGQVVDFALSLTTAKDKYNAIQ